MNVGQETDGATTSLGPTVDLNQQPNVEPFNGDPEMDETVSVVAEDSQPAENLEEEEDPSDNIDEVTV